MNNNKIKIGVLGCSSIADRLVLPAICNSKKLELACVASRSPEKALEFSRKYSCKPGTYENLLDDPEVTAVYVSLPAALHYEWGLKVLNAGKHLLMEKPFTHSLKTTQHLIDLAAAKKLVAMEALVYIYHPLYKKVHSLVNSNEIGNLRHIDAYFGFPYPPAEDIRNKPELGGGAILDNLIYPLSFCMNITGSTPSGIFPAIQYNSRMGIDERGAIQLVLGDITAHIVYGFGLMYRNSYCLWGSSGYLSAERVFSRPPQEQGDIVVIKQNERKLIPIEAANQFELMLDDFALKVNQPGQAGKINQGEEIINRMKIISGLYEKVLKK